MFQYISDGIGGFLVIAGLVILFCALDKSH